MICHIMNNTERIEIKVWRFNTCTPPKKLMVYAKIIEKPLDVYFGFDTIIECFRMLYGSDIIIEFSLQQSIKK